MAGALIAASVTAWPAKAEVTEPAVTAAFNGLIKDLVIGDDGASGLQTDEVNDGSYTLDITYSGSQVISRIDVQRGSEWWNTEPGDGMWVVGVTSDTSDAYLNSTDDGSVAIPFTDSKRLRLYLAGGSQALGAEYDVTVCFASGACAVTTVMTTAADGDSDGYSVVDDCNDALASINPGATEIPDDGIDQDCTNADLRTWYLDGDTDGYGATTPTDTDETQPAGYVDNDDDCDDGDVTSYPGGTEVADDGIDQDCSGADSVTFYLDYDGDTFGDPSSPQVADSAPDNHVTNDGDCNDADAAVNPDADEVAGNGEDDDCDSATPDVIEPADTTLGDISYSNGSYTNKGSRTSITTTVSSPDNACVAGRRVTFTITNTQTSGVTVVSAAASATGTSPAKVSVQLNLIAGQYDVSLSAEATDACDAGINEDAGTVMISTAKPKGRK